MSQASTDLTLEQSSKSFDGYQYVYSHHSWTVECSMKFGIYVPSIADREQVPLLIFLSGRTCTEQNWITKSGMQRLASKYGFLVANPDTSPRQTRGSLSGGSEVEVEDDFGPGAGFYVDATASRWSKNYQMFSYVNEEFYELILRNFNVDPTRVGIFGHSMGGHGALISFLKCPGQYTSVSALAPICNPSRCPWGVEAYRKFFGPDEHLWKGYDACELVSSYDGPLPQTPILIDQGSADPFKEEELLPERFLSACANASFPVQYREQLGYDHSYFFLITFLEDHFKYHQTEFEYSKENNKPFEE